MEPSSPVVLFSDELKKKDAEEDGWSEIHGLRRLYGLLQQTTDQRKQEEENLDDRSLILLKKLLDDATHQAIQSQSTVVSVNFAVFVYFFFSEI